MPGIVRKLLIFAAANGLILQPLTSRNQRAQTPIQINYESHSISPALHDVGKETLAENDALTAHGVLGLLSIASTSYLISISRRQLVAQFWGKPVFVITDVALIPISSQEEAQKAIWKAAERAKRHAREEDDAFDIEEDGEAGDHASISTEDDALFEGRTSVDDARISVSGTLNGDDGKAPGIAEEVITQKGAYGSLRERWFSPKGLGLDRRRLHDVDKTQRTPAASPKVALSADSSPGPRVVGEVAESGPKVSADRPSDFKPNAVDSLALKLLPKLLHTTRLLFMSRTFFFSYDNDITQRISGKPRASSDLPLYKQADAQYVWNRHLSGPFIKQGYHEFVLPVMQGFVGQRELSMDEAAPGRLTPPASISEADSTATATQSKMPHKTLLLTLISRRSVRRAGLRYLRRGIDENGHVANSVETEQILSTTDWNTDDDAGVHSFVQVRGSIPVFFSQTPYTFKPLPVLYGSTEANIRALSKHFHALASTYGAVHAVSLIDRHGPENAIGEAYESYVSSVTEATGGGDVASMPLALTWFEFHAVCRGMKFENVSQLVHALSPFLAQHAWTTVSAPSSTGSSSGGNHTTQSGIVRTNCMDCLDRTNVVQSAIALHMLTQQLQLQPPDASQHAATTKTTTTPPAADADPSFTAFNALWADNGDAVSRAYAGTAALKGDYTRTRRRNLRGALTDLTLTLERYYRNLFDDFFAQAAIDFLLGAARAAVFADFARDMTTADPAIDLRRARRKAVAAAAGVVLGTGSGGSGATIDGDDNSEEHLLHGWTLLAPAPNTLTRPLSEQVLLLTDAALYAVRVDWDLGGDKVLGYERVPLTAIVGLRRGVYITETFAPAQTDPELNQGLLVRFSAGDEESRVNTRSLETSPQQQSSVIGRGAKPASSLGENRILALKAVQVRSAFVHDEKDGAENSEAEIVNEVCREILRALGTASMERGSERVQVEIEEQDIMSIEDATHNTGYMEQLGYTLKKLVWG